MSSLDDVPNVTVVESTPQPERVICTSARNDYSQHWPGDDSYIGADPSTHLNTETTRDFEEIMAPIDGDDVETKIQNLISKLLKSGHFGPFEHPTITFAVKGMSRSCMAQLTRHRHASFDVQSMRYVSFEDRDPAPGEMFIEIPELNDPGMPGRNASMTDEAKAMADDERLEQRKAVYEDALERCHEAYQDLLELGVAPENARMILPIGTKVNVVFTVNARMLMHIADMRNAADAQDEIQQLTKQILDIAAEWCPATFEFYREEMANRKNRLAP